MQNLNKQGLKSWVRIRSVLGLYLIVCCLSACPRNTHEKNEAQTSSIAKVTWTWPQNFPEGDEGALVQYGENIIAQTAQYLGPDVSDPVMRFAGNRLSCSHCHLNKGTTINAAGFVGITQRYPQYYAPLNRVVSLEERINACFERSLNGKALPLASKEIQAMKMYMVWLSQETPEGKQLVGAGLPEIKLLDRPADLQQGEKIYRHSCAACHGSQGEGVLHDADKPVSGYVFPPVAGPDSYNTGSNMARLIVAARYIKANMPLGRAILTAEEAFDVAAYLNSLPRSDYALAGQDYPNLETKPIDVPYGPWFKDQSSGVHILGPFVSKAPSP